MCYMTYQCVTRHTNTLHEHRAAQWLKSHAVVLSHAVGRTQQKRKKEKKTTHFGINLMRSQVLYRAAQGSHSTQEMPLQINHADLADLLSTEACDFYPSTRTGAGTVKVRGQVSYG